MSFVISNLSEELKTINRGTNIAEIKFAVFLFLIKNKRIPFIKAAIAKIMRKKITKITIAIKTVINIRKNFN